MDRAIERSLERATQVRNVSSAVAHMSTAVGIGGGSGGGGGGSAKGVSSPLAAAVRRLRSPGGMSSSSPGRLQLSGVGNEGRSSPGRLQLNRGGEEDAGSTSLFFYPGGPADAVHEVSQVCAVPL